MHFALLVSDLPHLNESRAYYDALLSPDIREPKQRGLLGACKRLLSALFR